ncbi:putative membrane protein YdjX (TVP38/TMEM64 family) [Marisediminicola sp. UYEF4]|uniref:TVP38/TMEM64 family protein n=1 Tax=Marisediminicola sp. UYEF4 TaxID=1756384 RepID=UPI0033919C2A
MNDRGATTARRRALVKLAAFVVFVAVAVLVGVVVPLPGLDEIRSSADAAGWPGAVAFAVGYGLVTLTPVPKNVLSIAAGVVWGFAFGALLVYLGALLGAALAFAIGRGLGREAVERFTGARVERIDALLRRRGLVSIIGVRLIPVLPFTAINYAAGLTSVRRRDYALGTVLGIIPGTLAFVAVGGVGFEPGPGLYIALGTLGALSVAGAIVGIRMRRRGASTPPQTPTPTPTRGAPDA